MNMTRNVTYARYDTKRAYGFTLVEMMIVVAMVAILTSVALVAYQRHLKTGRLTNAREFITEIQAREESYYQQHGRYVTSDASFYPALVADEPQAKQWAAPPAGWVALGARPNDASSYFSFKVVASDPNNNHALDAEAATLRIPAQPSAPMTPHAWYYVIALGDMNGDAGATCDAAPLATDKCTIITATSARSAIVTSNEGE